MYMGVIIGLCIAITAYVSYSFYQMNKTVTQDSATLSQVVNFLNQQIQAQQKAVAPATK